MLEGSKSVIKNLIKGRLATAEEQVKPKDTLSFVVFDVQFSDGSRKRMGARDLFHYAILRDLLVASRGVEPGTILTDDAATPVPYISYEVIKGKWSDLPAGIVRNQIRSIKGV